MVNPAFENERSEEAEVAGIAKYLAAKFLQQWKLWYVSIPPFGHGSAFTQLACIYCIPFKSEILFSCELPFDFRIHWPENIAIMKYGSDEIPNLKDSKFYFGHP